MSSVKASDVIIASICAGVRALAVLLAMPTAQPVIVSVVESRGPLISADGQWASEFVEDLVVPGLPILLPILTFVIVYLHIGRRN